MKEFEAEILSRDLTDDNRSMFSCPLCKLAFNETVYLHKVGEEQHFSTETRNGVFIEYFYLCSKCGNVVRRWVKWINKEGNKVKGAILR